MKAMDMLVDAFIGLVNEDKEMRIEAGKVALDKFKKDDPVLVLAVHGLVMMGEDVEAGINRMIATNKDKPDKFRATLVICMAEYFKSVMSECDCEDCKERRGKHDTPKG